MSIQNQKQVILVTGDQTKWYEQAIFILKRGAALSNAPKDFLGEAESIVQAYLQGTPSAAQPASAPKTAKRPTTTDLNCILFLSCLTLAVVLGVQIFG